MKNFSLKMRLMLVFTTFFILIGISCGVVSWFEAKETTDEFFDTYQMALASNLASADWENVNHEILKNTNKELKYIKNADEDDEAIGFAVFNLQGKMVFHDNENGKNFIYNLTTGAFYNEEVDDDLWRIIRVKSADKNFIIAVGQELEYRSDVAWDLIEEFMLPWMVGLFILLLFMLLIIEREFKPLKRAAMQINNRNPQDLSAVETTDFPKEVMPLVDSINELLKKLASLLQQEKRFVADAAHELRTPLTALKVQLEVLELGSDDKASRDRAIANLGQGIVRASHLVEQLLAMSKLENSLVNGPQEREMLNWEKIINLVVADYQLAINDKKINLDLSNVSSFGPIHEANQTLIIMVVKNLLENAIKYSNDGADIKIYTDKNMLKVYNSGVQVKDEHLPFLSQRFYRPSGQNEKGSGLGLSIVKLIVNYYNCELGFSNVNNGFEVCVFSN